MTFLKSKEIVGEHICLVFKFVVRTPTSNLHKLHPFIKGLFARFEFK